MGGYCFFVEDKMCVGIDIDKNTGQDRLMARIGEKAMELAMKKKGCRLMDITGRPFKGFVFVYPEGFSTDEDLEYWIKLCIKYNPNARNSRQK
jgi:hypothetical protein